MAHGLASLLVRAPCALAYDQACTLPTVWSTVHVALEWAHPRSGQSALIHAAAGGVGLSATEYALWVRTRVVASAGQAKKHLWPRCMGAARCVSSRDGPIQPTFFEGFLHPRRGFDTRLLKPP